MTELSSFFKAHPDSALGLSGGVDSGYLLYAGVQAGARITPYFVQTPFQPAFERETAERICAMTGTALTVLTVDPLMDERVRQNSAQRCYYCKQRLFGTILSAAKTAGIPCLLDGTNASDDAGDRPGMRALEEMNVFSPLRLCGLTKREIRARARSAGLPNADTPAYACLATRIPTGMPIAEDMLIRVDRAETALRLAGYSDFRVRVTPDGGALVQLTMEQMPPNDAAAAGICAQIAPWFPMASIDAKPRITAENA